MTEPQHYTHLARLLRHTALELDAHYRSERRMDADPHPIDDAKYKADYAEYVEPLLDRAAHYDMMGRAPLMQAVLTRLMDSAQYWSDYDMIGIFDQMKEALGMREGSK